MRQSHSTSIPVAFEYIGMGEWAVRWDVQIDVNAPTSLEDGKQDDNEHYVYNEEIYHVKPDYGIFVTNRIRDKYTEDEENALKSNMLTAMLTPDSDKSKEILAEWEEYETHRANAKEIGKQIFI